MTWKFHEFGQYWQSGDWRIFNQRIGGYRLSFGNDNKLVGRFERLAAAKEHAERQQQAAQPAQVEVSA